MERPSLSFHELLTVYILTLSEVSSSEEADVVTRDFDGRGADGLGKIADRVPAMPSPRLPLFRDLPALNIQYFPIMDQPTPFSAPWIDITTGPSFEVFNYCLRSSGTKPSQPVAVVLCHGHSLPHQGLC